MSPIIGDVPYYGVLIEVVELHYLGENKVVLFKCDWWDVTNIGREIKNDEYDYTFINFARILPTNEPFVLASQAKQVFYVKNLNESDWHNIQLMQPQDLYQMNGEVSSDDFEPFQQSELHDDHKYSSHLVDEYIIK